MKKDKIIIWGTGEEAKKLISLIGTEQVLCFADNNARLWGKDFFKKKIVSLEEVSLLKEEYLIVISPVKYEKEIKRQLHENGIENFINGREYRICQIFSDDRQRQKRIILLNTHDDASAGDHAITIAELFFFRKYLPEYAVLEVPLDLCIRDLDDISRFVTEEDLLIVSGGGFLGSLWLDGGERNVRKIVRQFPANRIVVFPQTMYFENHAEGRKQRDISRRVYNSHHNLTFCFRDEVSYRLGMELFRDTVQKRYVPDMVTLLNRSGEIYPRKDILTCMRKDKERILCKGALREVEKYFRQNHHTVTEMSMFADGNADTIDRMDIINDKMRRIQTSRMVITDRLHCMLFCAISGTPCLAFDNISGKVHGVYDWIKELPYIRLARTGMDYESEIKRLLNMRPMAYESKRVEREFEQLADFLKIEGNGNV